VKSPYKVQFFKVVSVAVYWNVAKYRWLGRLIL
jgi:hypothetical protein